MMIIWIPVFEMFGKRIRARVRFISWRGFHYRREDFEEDKTVIRVWLGFALLTVMIAPYSVLCSARKIEC